jgi:hypothetical protein
MKNISIKKLLNLNNRLLAIILMAAISFCTPIQAFVWRDLITARYWQEDDYYRAKIVAGVAIVGTGVAGIIALINAEETNQQMVDQIHNHYNICTDLRYGKIVEHIEKAHNNYPGTDFVIMINEQFLDELGHIYITDDPQKYVTQLHDDVKTLQQNQELLTVQIAKLAQLSKKSDVQEECMREMQELLGYIKQILQRLSLVVLYLDTHISYLSLQRLENSLALHYKKDTALVISSGTNDRQLADLITHLLIERYVNERYPYSMYTEKAAQDSTALSKLLTQATYAQNTALYKRADQLLKHLSHIGIALRAHKYELYKVEQVDKELDQLKTQLRKLENRVDWLEVTWHY